MIEDRKTVMLNNNAGDVEQQERLIL